MVTTEEGTKLGKDIDYPFYEVSAKEGINVNECFDDIIKKILKKTHNITCFVINIFYQIKSQIPRKSLFFYNENLIRRELE